MAEETVASISNYTMSQTKNSLRGVDKRHKIQSDYSQIERMVEDKQKLIEETTEKIRRREIEIAERETIIKKRDVEIARLHREIETLRQEIDAKQAEQEETITNLVGQIKDLNSEVDLRDQQLEEMEQAVLKAVERVKGLLGERGFMVEESVENLSQFVSNCQKTSKVLKSSSLALPDNSKSEISQLSFGQFSSADLSSLLEKHLALLETKLSEESASLSKQKTDAEKALSQMSALKQRTDKAQQQAKLLRQQLSVCQSDIIRLKQSLKSSNQILSRSQSSRLALIKQFDLKLEKARKMDQGDTSIQGLRNSKHVLQIKLMDIEKKLQAALDENIVLRSEGLRSGEEMLMNFRKIQKTFEEKLMQKETEIKMLKKVK